MEGIMGQVCRYVERAREKELGRGSDGEGWRFRS